MMCSLFDGCSVEMMFLFGKQVQTVIINYFADKDSEMSEKQQMHLRPRRPFPYLPPDTEDPDNFISSRPYSHRDTSSPATQISSSARILIKFIHSANKSLRDCIKPEQFESKPKASFQGSIEERPLSKLKFKEPKPPKTNTGRKEYDKVQKVNEKEPNNIKDKINLNEKSKFLAETDGMYKSKPNPLKQLSANQELMNFCASIKKVNPGISTEEILGKIMESFQGTQFNHPEAASRALLQQQLQFSHNPLLDTRQPQMRFPPSSLNNAQKDKNQESKLFGRSAYHVAIAYHIHLKKIKDDGRQIQNSMALDPTYNARRLRGEKMPQLSE